MRVLHVVTSMNRAGLETVIMNYYRKIDRKKIQFDFLTHRFHKGDYDDEIKKLGGKIYCTYPIHPKYFLQYIKWLNRFFKEHPEYQIVHSHIDALSTFPLYAAKKAGVPVRIAHSHNTDFDKDFKLPLRHISKVFLSKQATHYWGCSKAAVQFMFGNKIFQTGQYMVLNNAIDAGAFDFNSAIRNEYRSQLELNEKFVIGHIGRFSYQKNHEFLIKIFESVHKQHKNAILLLIGDGEIKEQIQEEVRILGLEENVRFLGVRSDIPQLMQAMDVFVLPSRFEGLPVVGVEAQAAGLPCLFSKAITTDVNITNNTQFIDLDFDVKYWVEKILMCKEFIRKNTYEQVKSAGYDIVNQTDKLKNFYLQDFM